MRGFFGLMVIVLMVVGNVGCTGGKQSKSNTDSNIHNNNSTISYANDMATFNEIINSSTPVLVDFYADWCAPCRMVAPILEQVASDMKGEVKVIKVNVDKNRSAASKYGIQSIPTLMLFQNGSVQWKGVGVMQADQIKHIVESKAKI